MSSSVPIPSRASGPWRRDAIGSSASPSSSSSTDNNFVGFSGMSPASLSSTWNPSPSSSAASSFQPSSLSGGVAGKGKAPMGSSRSTDTREGFAARRPSLMGTSLSKSEHTVIHLGSSDGAPRLVTCVKSSQGFDWNQELFLPSYADYESHDLEHWQEPVQDIVLTEEEAAAMLPR